MNGAPALPWEGCLKCARGGVASSIVESRLAQRVSKLGPEVSFCARVKVLNLISSR